MTQIILPSKAQVDLLLDRITDVRAGRLDNLDTLISSRMPGTTIHRDRIDVAISSVKTIVTVQRGLTTLSNTNTSIDISISTVNMSKTFVNILTVVVNGAAQCFEGQLINSTTLRIKGTSTGIPWSREVAWEVIEFS